jgi:hypothetical protein
MSSTKRQVRKTKKAPEPVVVEQLPVVEPVVVEQPAVVEQKKRGRRKALKIEIPQPVDEEVVVEEKAAPHKPLNSDKHGTSIPVNKVNTVVVQRVIDPELYNILGAISDAVSGGKVSPVFPEDASNEDKKEIRANAVAAQKEQERTNIASFSLASLDAQTLASLRRLDAQSVAEQRDKYERANLKSIVPDYNLKVRTVGEDGQEKNGFSPARAEFDEKRNAYLPEEDVFCCPSKLVDLQPLFKSYSPSFYNEFHPKTVDGLTGEELYKYCRALVSQYKSRYNPEVKVILTVFVEYVMRELARHCIGGCIEEGKRVVALHHLFDRPISSPVLQLVKSLPVYRSAFVLYDDDDNYHQEEKKKKTNPALQDFLKDVVLNEFLTPVLDLFKSVRVSMDIDATVSVSGEMKFLCTGIINELLVQLGKCLRINLTGAKTFNAERACNAIHTLLALHNADGDFQHVHAAIRDIYREYKAKHESHDADE